MKKLFLLTAVIAISLAGTAQGKSEKKEKVTTVRANKNTNANVRQNTTTNVGKNNGHDDVYQSNQNTSVKYSKNLPTNVNSSFNRDYPNATNVTWTKSRGNWIATFPNGYYRTSVTYAANGQRTNTTRRRVRS